MPTCATRPQFSRLIVLASLALLMSSGPAAADPSFELTTTRLTEFLAPSGAVEDAAISPDGGHIVYLASQDSAGVDELYSVPVDGGAVIRLNPSLVTGGNVLDFAISPDSSHVAFRTDTETDEKVELFVAPIGGGAAVKVNGPMVPSGDVENYAFSHDNLYLLYTANQLNFQIVDLFSHRLASAAVTKLSPTLAAGDGVRFFTVSPDSSRVAFVTNDSTGASIIGEPWSVPIDGGTASEIGNPDDIYPTVAQLAWTGDSNFLVYRGFESPDTNRELRRAPATGGASTQLTRVDDRINSDFFLTPDGATAVAVVEVGADEELIAIDIATAAVSLLLGPIDFITLNGLSPDGLSAILKTDGLADPATDGLKSLPVAGGALVDLGAPSSVTELIFSPNGDRLLYRDMAGFERHELFSVPTNGGAPPVQLDLAALGDDGVTKAAFNDSGTNVVFVSDDGPAGLTELYTVPAAGGTAVRLNDALLPGEEIRGSFCAGDDVLYWAEQETKGLVELYRLTATGGPTTKVNAPLLGTSGRTGRFAISPTDDRVVYEADQNVAGQDELWSFDLSAGGPAIRLSEAPFAISQVVDFLIEPSGTHVLFRASRDVADLLGLYRVPIDGGAVDRLDPDVGDIDYWQLGGDGQWVLFEIVVDPIPNPVHKRLYRAEAESGDLLILFDTGGVPPYDLSPDGQYILYADGDRLLSMPLATGAAVELDPDADLEGVTPDSSRVIYRDNAGLWSVPIGGGTPIHLGNGAPACPPTSIGNVLGFTSNSDRLVYTCGSAFLPDLWVTPVLGGPATFLMDGSEFGSIHSVLITPDGSRVVVTHLGGDGPFRITTVPLVGGAVQVIDEVPAQDVMSSVSALGISADSRSLIYGLNPLGFTGPSLFRHTLGTTETIQLNPDGEWRRAAVNDAGTRAFYVAAPLTQQDNAPLQSQMASVSIDGGPVLIHHLPVPAGSHVQLFEIAPDGLSVAYRADQDADDVYDLYFSRVTQVLFQDGFESGDLSAWSLTAGN